MTRGKRITDPRRLVLSLAMVILTVGYPQADLLGDEFVPLDPEYAKPVRLPVTAELDWGPFAHRVTRRHAVAEGETLGAIAKRYLGSVQRWRLIAEENPEAVPAPDRIAIGASLWIPPRLTLLDDPSPYETQAPGAGLLPHYDAFWVESGYGQPQQVVARATPGALPHEWTSGGTLLLVPHELAAPVIQGLRDGPLEIPDSVRAASYLAPFSLVSPLVAPGDRAKRAIARFQLDHLAGRVVKSIETLVFLDAEGQEVRRQRGPWTDPPLDAVAGEAPEARRWSPQLGIAIALGGLALVLGIATARRRQAGGSG